MIDYDHVAELADRMLARRPGDEGDFEFEFEIEWAALTEAEREAFFDLMDQRIAQREEVLEAKDANARALRALLLLQVQRAPGMTVVEAIGSGRIGLAEVVEAIRSADALA